MTRRPSPHPYASDVDLDEVVAAILEYTSRVAALLRSATGSSVPALGVWDLTGLALHVSHAIDGVKSMARGTESLLGDLWEQPAFMQMLVGGETERDLGAVAERIEASVTEFLSVIEAGRSGDGGTDRAWLFEGTRMTLPNLGCHVLNELVVHGRDMAEAEGAPWPISRHHASLVLRGFLFPAVSALGKAMVDQEKAAGLRANYEIRLRGGGCAFFLFDDGNLTVTAAPPEQVDCHLLVEPAPFLLVAWGRQSQWSRIARGQLLAWGRRPWLGVKLRGLMRNP